MELTDENFEGVLFSLHEYQVNPFEREIYVGGHVMNCENDYEVGVGPEMADRFIKNMTLLQSISHDPIVVHMCTVGGDWSYGMAMYDAIKESPCLVCVVAYAHARSMSSIIPQAADWRVIMPNAFFMAHEGEIGYEGTQKGGVSYMEQAEKDMKVMLDVYLRRALVPREKIVERMNSKQEWYMDAKTSVTLGFMDEIYDGDMSKLKSGEYGI
jgi:ATP-dependent protease ClpP protease subunit